MSEILKNLFKQNFNNLRIVMILTLAILSIVYNVLYHKKVETYTLLHIEPTRVILDAIAFGVGGLITVIFVNWSRNNLNRLAWSSILILFTIVALFTFAQESSGYNRFLNKKKIEKESGIYGKFYKSKNINVKELIGLEKNGDPFLLSFAYLFFIVVFSIIFYYIFNLIFITYKSIRLGVGHIDKIGNIMGKTNIKYNWMKYLLFFCELLVIIISNSMPHILSPYIRGEENKIKKKKKKKKKIFFFL